MFIIGLTGGIATGKSTVVEMLRKKGAYIIDADRLAREVVKPDQPAWQEIVDWLGDQILLNDRTLDRGRLAELVFSDNQKLQILNGIIHPRVGSRILELTREIERQNPAAVVIYDIPLLIEAGMQEMTDLVLLVYAPRDIQLRRLMARDRLSLNEAEMRLAAQMPIEEKKKHVHQVIDNSRTIVETKQQVEAFWDNLGCIKTGHQ
jgi:dephospho-CoA kinase